MGMTFASALSTDPESVVAEQRCVAALEQGLGASTPDLLLFFVTHHYASALEGLSRRLREATGARVVAGCTGRSVLGGDKEIEHKPGLALWAAHLPDTEVRVEHQNANFEEGAGFRFEPALEVGRPDKAGVILLADPFSFPAQVYLPELSSRLPGVPVVGGQASGGQGPHQNLLWCGDEVLDQGALAIVMEGETELLAAVSQGCRPIGNPLVVTACRGNLIQKLRGEGAAKVMFEVIESLADDERELFRRGAHIGLAVDATKSAFEAEDLLVRGVLGIHPQEDAVAVADDSLRVGQSIQFMVRDASSASEELSRILTDRAPDWSPAEPGQAGALLFTCGGRGAHMFRTLHHDAGAVQQHIGPGLPLAGFFADGEIGPVGGQSFLHAFTASLALVRDRR